MSEMKFKIITMILLLSFVIIYQWLCNICQEFDKELLVRSLASLLADSLAVSPESKNEPVIECCFDLLCKAFVGMVETKSTNLSHRSRCSKLLVCEIEPVFFSFCVLWFEIHSKKFIKLIFVFLVHESSCG